MLDISKIHPHTLGTCVKYGVNISQYDSVEELRAECQRRYRSTPEYKSKYVGIYQTDPERYKANKRRHLAKKKATKEAATASPSRHCSGANISQ